jgi:hypothetical protein
MTSRLEAQRAADQALRRVAEGVPVSILAPEAWEAMKMIAVLEALGLINFEAPASAPPAHDKRLVALVSKQTGITFTAEVDQVIHALQVSGYEVRRYTHGGIGSVRIPHKEVVS